MLELVRTAPRRGFYPTLALLERLTPGAIQIGRDGPPQREPIRLRHDPSMAFQAGEIARIEASGSPGAEPTVIAVISTFLGLCGSASPLPLYLSAEVAHQAHQGGPQAAFLDIFHHRLLSLLFRQWARYRPTEEMTTTLDDPWSRRLRTLLGADAFDTVPSALTALERLQLAGVFAGRARTAAGLSHMLDVMLRPMIPGIRIEIRQRTGKRTRLSSSHQLLLATPSAVIGKSGRLGRAMPARTGRFRIVLHGLPVERTHDFLAGGAQHLRLGRAIAEYLREPLDFDLELQFSGAAAHNFALCKRNGAALGRRTFLKPRRSGTQTVVTRGVSESLVES